MKPFSLLQSATFIGVAALFAAANPALAEPLVYVPLGSENRIVVIDAARDKVVGSIDGVPAVHGLAKTPDGSSLVAGSFDEREPGGTTPPKPTGMSEEEHAAHHGGGSSGAMQRPDSVISTVSIIGASDGSVMRRIDVPGAVHHVTVGPKGRYAAVTHPNQGTVSIIDLKSYEVVTTIPTGPFPNYAAFGPQGDNLYVSNAGNDTVSAIDTGRWIVKWNVVTGASPEHVVLSQDGKRLYVNNVQDGTVSVIATDSQEVVKTLPAADTPHGIDLSEDGDTLFVASLGEDKLIAIDLETGNTRSAALAPAPYHLATIAGTGKVYVSSADEPKIWVVDQNSLAVHGEIRIGGKGHQMVQGMN